MAKQEPPFNCVICKKELVADKKELKELEGKGFTHRFWCNNCWREKYEE